MYVCMYACMYVCMHACVCVCVCVECVCVCVCVLVSGSLLIFCVGEDKSVQPKLAFTTEAGYSITQYHHDTR